MAPTAQTKAPRDVGWCLSGGGFRAATYHLGSLIRLNEAGLLSRLRTVSSVSGGSIVAGFLGLRWPDLTFADGVATNLTEVVVEPMLEFTSHGLDVAAVLSAGFLPGLVSRRVQQRYAALFGSSTLADLPATPAPDFVITATNLATGGLFRFSRGGVGDFRADQTDTATGFFQAPDVPLTLAVAASSAFPPVLSPCVFRASRYASARGAQRTAYLTDGGVYDNLGIEPLKLPQHTIVLSSDGGAPFSRDPRPPIGYLRGTVHVLMVVDLQVRKLRRSELVAMAGPKRRIGYWAVSSDLAGYVTAKSTPERPFEVLPADPAATAELAQVSTRLTGLPRDLQERLVNWGYAGADAALRAYVLDDAAIGSFPFPRGVG